MSWLADAHREWHYVHGAPGQSDEVCPLDCYDPPEDYDPEDYEEPDATPIMVEGSPGEVLF